VGGRANMCTAGAKQGLTRWRRQDWKRRGGNCLCQPSLLVEAAACSRLKRQYRVAKLVTLQGRPNVLVLLPRSTQARGSPLFHSHKLSESCASHRPSERWHFLPRDTSLTLTRRLFAELPTAASHDTHGDCDRHTRAVYHLLNGDTRLTRPTRSSCGPFRCFLTLCALWSARLLNTRCACHTSVVHLLCLKRSCRGCGSCMHRRAPRFWAQQHAFLPYICAMRLVRTRTHSHSSRECILQWLCTQTR